MTVNFFSTFGCFLVKTFPPFIYFFNQGDDFSKELHCQIISPTVSIKKCTINIVNLFSFKNEEEPAPEN